MREDAEVIIKITGDSKDFDSKMMKLARDYKNKEIDMKITSNELEQAKQKLNEMNNVNDDIEKNIKDINNQIKEYEKQIDILKEKNAGLNYQDWEQKRIILDNKETIKSLNSKIEAQKRLAGEVVIENNKQLDAILKQYDIIDKIEGKYEKQKNDLDVIGTKIKEIGSVDIGSKVDNAGKSINKTIKKVGKWALAIFGIRSAYMGIRRIMSGVLSQNEGLSKQMDGIKNSLYAAFTPVIEKIINLIKTLMGYANAVWQRLFGHDLFKATSKSAEKTASAAKEINKQLAGFDEANVLSANNNGGGTGGDSSGGFNIPIKKLPDWLEKFIDWCKDNPKLAGILFGTVAFTLFGLVKLGKALTEQAIAKLIGKAGVGSTAAGASGLLGLLGILTLLATTAYVIYLDYKYITEAIEEAKKLDDAIKHRNETNENTIMQNNAIFQTNLEVLKSEKATDEQRQQAIKNINTLTKSTREMSEVTYGGAKNSVLWGKTLQENAIDLDKVYRSGKLTEEQQYEYYKMLKNQLNPTLEASKNWIYGQTEENKKLKSSFEALDKKYSTKYAIEITESGTNKIKTALDKLGNSFETLYKKWNTSSLGKAVNKVASTLGIKIDTTKYASGGIVNMPGRGVPISSAIAGEAGREGIVPMDNESQMQLLGQAIAKYVNINNYVTTNVDSRKLNQILKQSENKERLANNW